MFPDAKPTIGPPIDHGFYYDFHMDPIGDEELKAIEKKMNQHIRANHAMIREEYDNQTLRDMFSDNKFKLEIMDDKIGHDVGSSVYRQGDFVDLCRGPHVPSTSHLRWFKLTGTSTAYWRADTSENHIVQNLWNVLCEQRRPERTSKANSGSRKKRPQENWQRNGTLHD